MSYGSTTKPLSSVLYNICATHRRRDDGQATPRRFVRDQRVTFLERGKYKNVPRTCRSAQAQSQSRLAVRRDLRGKELARASAPGSTPPTRAEARLPLRFFSKRLEVAERPFAHLSRL